VSDSGHKEKTHDLEMDKIHSAVAGHEEGDINIGPVYKFLAWLAVFMIFTYSLVYGIMKWNDSRMDRENAVMTHMPKSKMDQLPVEPRLQLAPGHGMHPLEEGIQYRDSVIQVLESYGYLNKATGNVHIPIDLAKDLLLKKGLPVRAQQADANESAVMIPEFSSAGRTTVARDQRIPGGTFTVTGGNLNVQNK
jgi:hypothetical protein